MAINTAAGSQVFIGTTLAATDLAGFQADSYIKVGSVESVGEFGDQANIINFTSLDDRRVQKFKGSFDAGELAVVAGSDPEDVGQQQMTAAFASDLDFNFKVMLNDQLTLGGDPTTLYFKGKVTSKRRNVGNVENVVRQNFTVGINSEIIEDPAS